MAVPLRVAVAVPVEAAVEEEAGPQTWGAGAAEGEEGLAPEAEGPAPTPSMTSATSDFR